MVLEKKGMLAPFTILTSIFTGIGFPLLGILIALDLGVIKQPYMEGIILVLIGGFLAQWTQAHTIHDLYHYDKDERITLSKKSLKTIFVISTILLFTIMIYLTIQRGWPILVFAIVGAIVSMYAEGLIHHESQMAIGATFLVIGGFYVQTATLNLEPIIWIKTICIAIFAFLSQYGWLKLYRLDDYGFSDKLKNRNILITKSSLIFIIIYILL